jgi:hypothetical protein
LPFSSFPSSISRFASDVASQGSLMPGQAANHARLGPGHDDRHLIPVAHATNDPPRFVFRFLQARRLNVGRVHAG